MSKTIERKPCDICHSSNNLVTWEHEGKTYTKCQTPNCQKNITQLQLANTFNNAYDSKKQNKLHMNYDSITDKIDFLTGIYKETRGLTEETCRKCGIMMQGDSHIFQYNNAQKIRIPKGNKKDMYWIGDSKEAGLFGEHLTYDYSKEIIITEGEFDAASLIQSGYQAYSIKGGAGGQTKEEIKSKANLINSFREIIIWFDNDSAGQEALKQVLESSGLDTYKIRLVNEPQVKDANELLTTVHESLIKDCIDYAKDYIPEGLIFGDQLDFSILEQHEDIGLLFPYTKFQDCFHGLRKGEILLIGAGSGAGKSLFAKIMILYWMQNVKDVRISNIFLEEKQKFTLQSLMGLSLKRPTYQLIEMPYNGLAEQAKNLLGKHNYIFDNHFGSLQSKILFNKIRYLAHKSDVIILDHISIVVSGMDGNDERKDIDRLMTTIKTIAMETGVRFIIISHLRRANGDNTYEQGMPITSNSFRGSHSLYQLSDSVIGLERNQQDEFTKNKVTIRGLKNRFKGDVGILDELYYNNDTGCLDTLEDMFK